MAKNSERRGCLAALLGLLGINIGGTSKDTLPYGLRDDFLTAAEFSFFKVLKHAVGESAVICPKVNLADLFYVKRPNENQSFRNKIDRKHVDFVICAPTMTPICAIELDDSSHARKDRIERDRFVDEVFLTAELPLIRVKAARSYSVKELGELLKPHLGRRITSQPRPSSASTEPTCPKCHEEMVLRTAKKGANKGGQFWGCKNYPQCKEVVRL